MTDTPRSAQMRPRAVPTGRFARFTRLGGLATGLAGRAAVGRAAAAFRGEQPDMAALLLTQGNVTRITERLAEMRGATMKLGQLLSMESGGVLPPELAEILARLRSDADAMPPKQLKDVLTQSYGAEFRRHFKSFNTQPLAAASIGQVHRATASDGMRLALKLQYLGVRASIDSDLDNAAALIRWVRPLAERTRHQPADPGSASSIE